MIYVLSKREIRTPLELLDDVSTTAVPALTDPELVDAFGAGRAALISGARLAHNIANAMGHRRGVLYLFIGNGGWLVQRLVKPQCAFQPWMAANISRETAEPIPRIGASFVVIVEDVVETGETGRRILEAIKLASPSAHVALATLVWHDRASTHESVDRVFGGFDDVFVGLRMRSTLPAPHHDLRSLSTLARKAGMPKNAVYAENADAFHRGMAKVLEREPWLWNLGGTLGFRPDICTPPPGAVERTKTGT